MLYRSLTRAGLLVLVGLVAACASAAPELPPDYGSTKASKRPALTDFSAADSRMTCGAIAREYKSSGTKMAALAARVRSRHGQNQAVGYAAGVLFPPLVLALNNSPEEKKAYLSLQSRRDTLSALSRAKRCRV